MLRRQFLQSVGGAALAQTGPLSRVLLIVAEGWRGWPPEQTRNMKRLEREGVSCTRAYATCPESEAAHAVLSSGQYAHVATRTTPVLS